MSPYLRSVASSQPHDFLSLSCTSSLLVNPLLPHYTNRRHFLHFLGLVGVEIVLCCHDVFSSLLFFIISLSVSLFLMYL